LLEEAIETLDAPLFAHQVECHPLLQRDRLRKLAREHGHHLVAYTPLAKGDVTGIPELVDIAEDRGATPAQVALAWLLSKEPVAAIPKSESPEHIEENVGALDVELTEAEIEAIDDIDREKRYVDFEEAPWNQ
jgi:2,5-diketo-D-gluconate reductase B